MSQEVVSPVKKFYERLHKAKLVQKKRQIFGKMKTSLKPTKIIITRKKKSVKANKSPKINHKSLWLGKKERGRKLTIPNFRETTTEEGSPFSRQEVSTPVNIRAEISLPKSTFSTPNLKGRKTCTPANLRLPRTFKLPPKPSRRISKSRQHSNKLRLIIKKADEYLKQSKLERSGSQMKPELPIPKKNSKRSLWIQNCDKSKDIRNRKLMTLYSSTTLNMDIPKGESFKTTQDTFLKNSSFSRLAFNKKDNDKSESFESQSSNEETEKKDNSSNMPFRYDRREVLETNTRKSLWTKNIVCNIMNHKKLSTVIHLKS
ncbi:unnamed protein product [Moneuplotes crassus]|uniref:Uncharacterized protein n=1 Tax=Euplotes crassus TaxID=5936 RepID=A0AAD1UJG9_EUPCR|nr:unnamed protein product [Moneuplotes crassus]